MNRALRDMAAWRSWAGVQRMQRGVQDDTTRPAGGCDRSWTATGGLFRGNVLLAADPRHRQAVFLERLEARSEEHTSELQSLMRISYAVFCLKKKTNT